MSSRSRQLGVELEPRKTAIIVVDMQNDFLQEGAPLETPTGRAFLDDLSTFVEACRASGCLIVYTRDVHRASGCDIGSKGELWRPIGEQDAFVDGTTGAEIHDSISPRAEDVVVDKRRYSGFFGTDLDTVLRNAGTSTVVITGVTTENCCASTARDAQFRDYEVVFVRDLTGTFEYPDQGFGAKSAREIHETVCTIIGTSVGAVRSSAEVLDALDAREVPIRE